MRNATNIVGRTLGGRDEQDMMTSWYPVSRGREMEFMKEGHFHAQVLQAVTKLVHDAILTD
jgi:hypothetical protein